MAATLTALARRLGLAPVDRFIDVQAVEHRLMTVPLAYVFIAAVPDPRRLKPLVSAIRSATSLRMRFAPLIYFADTASADMIRACVGLGFDDIVTHPFTVSKVAERLERLVDRPVVFYETPTYFGPDRRGRLEANESHELRGSGGQYRRLEIVRTERGGVDVVRDEVHVAL